MNTLRITKGSALRCLLTIAPFLLALNGCTDRVYKHGLARDWDCGAYHLSLKADGTYDLSAQAGGQRYLGTYQVDEAPSGGHTIKWTGPTNPFTTENTFVQGPSSDGEMAIGPNAGSTGTMCSVHRLN